MKKILIYFEIVLLFAIFIFYASACNKLPQCENPQAATIVYFGDDYDTCACDEEVYIVLDDMPNDTLIIENKIQNKYKKNGLRVEVEWKISETIHYNLAGQYPSNWCGPKIPFSIEVTCINEP